MPGFVVVVGDVMGQTVTNSNLNVPLKMLALRGEGALNDVEKRKRHGATLGRAIELAHMNRDQAAFALGDIDKGQLSRWLSGKEHAQTWRFEQHDQLGRALIVAQAETRRDDFDVAMVITLKRRLA